MDELDVKATESKAAYEEIKSYMENKFDFKVSSLYIAQIKRKCGLEVGKNYNISKKENRIIPNCPPEKEDAIMDAKIQSTEASNAIEGIVTTSTRIKQLVEEKTTPKNRSGDDWHEGNEDALPFVKYILSTILAAYKDFEDRFFIVEEKLPAVDMVRKASLNKIGKFTKQDIRELCPSLSVSSIEGALRKLVANGELKREGTGKATYYIRLK